MSLTLSVTSSTTLFVTNVPVAATQLLFESSVDNVTYTTLVTVPASPITIPVGTTAYSLTVPLIPLVYYKVTVNGSSATTQYILQTKGATGSSTSSFSNIGSGTPTIGATSVTMTASGNAIASDQTYSATQGVYYQLNTPIGASMGNGNSYTMSLYNTASGTGSASTISAYFRVTTTSGTTTATLYQRDGAAETIVGSAITLSTNPTNLALYWDGANTVYYYVGNTLRATYRFTSTWTTVKGAIQVETLAVPFTLLDMRLYATGAVPTSTNWRLNVQNVTVTSLTSATTPSISIATYGTYYYITNSGFNALTLPTITTNTDTGAFFVLRNNTSAYLSVTLTGGGSLSSPMVIPPSNSVTVVWTGSAYVLF